MFALVVLVFQY